MPVMRGGTPLFLVLLRRVVVEDDETQRVEEADRVRDLDEQVQLDDRDDDEEDDGDRHDASVPAARVLDLGGVPDRTHH